MANPTAAASPATIARRPDRVELVLATEVAVLLGRRKAGPGAQEVWDLPGGEIASGERPADAAMRIAAEQLALEVVRLDVVSLGTLDTDTSRLHFLATKRWTGTPRVHQQEVFSELGWFAPSAIRRMEISDPRLADMASLALATFLPDGI